MRHALPSRVLPDLIRHPILSIPQGRNVLRQVMTVWDCGSKPARTREKALSTSCESTFIGLRKYIQWLMKALSKIRCPCHQRTYTYFVGEVLLTCPMKYIFFEKGVYLLWKVQNGSLLLVIHFHLIRYTSSEDAQPSIYITIYPDGFCQACVDQMIGKRSI